MNSAAGLFRGVMQRKDHEPLWWWEKRKGKKEGKPNKESPPKASDLPEKANLGSCLPLHGPAVYQMSHSSCLEHSTAPE